MNAVEREVMNFALRGEHPALAVLREQLAVAVVSGREFTGVGFITNFTVPESAPRLPKSRIIIEDVHAEVNGLQYGAGFLVFTAGGMLATLECFIYEDAWPTDASIRRLFYARPRKPDDACLVETTERDFSYALQGT